MPTKKADIRSVLLKMRESLDPAEAKRLSEIILSNLKNLEQYQQANFIHTYISSKRSRYAAADRGELENRQACHRTDHKP